MKSFNAICALVFMTGSFFASTVPAQDAVVVDYPKAGDTLIAGTTVAIKWHSASATGVNIEVSYDNGLSSTLINEQAVNNTDAQWGNFSWVVPDTSAAACMVTISDYGNFASFGQSGVFVIKRATPSSQNSKSGMCGKGAILALVAPLWMRFSRQRQKRKKGT